MLRGCQRSICFLSLTHEKHRQNAFTYTNNFIMFLSNLRVKLPIPKTIEGIFEGMTYQLV